MTFSPRVAVQLAILSFLLTGCSSQQKPAAGAAPGQPDTRPCVVNYSAEGNFWKGKLFRSFEEFPRVSKAAAFDAIATEMTVKGGQINSMDKDIGIISAAATVTGGEGATVPINAVVKAMPNGGSRVDLSVRLSTGQVALGSMTDGFCRTLAVVEQLQPAAPAAAKKSKKK